MAGKRRGPAAPPPWIANLLALAVLIAMTLAWFVVQTREAQRGFLEDTRIHARLLADAVALHARGAVLAQDVVDSVLVTFLGSSARFVDYLDGIEPFSEDELRSFAAEAGLASIRVLREPRPRGAHAGTPASVPAGQRAPEESGADCVVLGRLIRVPSAHRILFAASRGAGPGCILVGMDSRQIERLQDSVSLARALDAVGGLPGILNIGLSGEPDPILARAQGSGEPRVGIRRLPDGRTAAEAHVPVAGAELLIALDADPLLRLRKRLWQELGGLVLLLATGGGLGSWLLYRSQRAHDRDLRAYERALSVQREEAGLGRAAAAIAHEIRNPLNAMAMGLQRLQMEAEALDAEHRRLLALVLDALRRTDRTVAGLLDYARPERPRPQAILLDRLVQDSVSLYERRIRDLGGTLSVSLAADTALRADPDLLRRCLDNLLRNAVEALPRGGELNVRVERQADGAVLTLANDGLAPETQDVERLLEPWFTTKTQGTGLGLPIARRIVEAHGGQLLLDRPAPGRLRVRATLPRQPPEAQPATSQSQPQSQ